MGMADTGAKLSRLTQTLARRWMDTRQQWDDAQAREFDVRYLQPLQTDLRLALTAMDQASRVLTQMYSECR